MPIPAFDERGLLPPGIYDCSLDELEKRFGTFQGSDRRPRLIAKLKAFISEARMTGLVRNTAMIESDLQLRQAIEQIDNLYRALDSLRVDILPKNPRNFAVFAEGPLDEITKLQADINAYINGLRSRPEEQVTA